VTVSFTSAHSTSHLILVHATNKGYGGLVSFNPMGCEESVIRYMQKKLRIYIYIRTGGHGGWLNGRMWRRSESESARSPNRTKKIVDGDGDHSSSIIHGCAGYIRAPWPGGRREYIYLYMLLTCCPLVSSALSTRPPILWAHARAAYSIVSFFPRRKSTKCIIFFSNNLPNAFVF
jgi:hypothetical protein